GAGGRVLALAGEGCGCHHAYQLRRGLVRRFARDLRQEVMGDDDGRLGRRASVASHGALGQHEGGCGSLMYICMTFSALDSRRFRDTMSSAACTSAMSII